MDELKDHLKDLTNIQGIFYEDLGVYYLFKDLNYELINFQTHFNTNKDAIEYQLELGNDSLVIASDLTYQEIESIVKYLPNRLGVFLFGKVEVMYSRRLLKSNYQKNYQLKRVNNYIQESRTKIKFELSENEYGTYIFDYNFYNGLDLIKLAEFVKFFIINGKDIEIDDLIKLISLITNDEVSDVNKLFTNLNRTFLDQETIYRVKDGE